MTQSRFFRHQHRRHLHHLSRHDAKVIINEFTRNSHPVEYEGKTVPSVELISRLIETRSQQDLMILLSEVKHRINKNIINKTHVLIDLKTIMNRDKLDTSEIDTLIKCVGQINGQRKFEGALLKDIHEKFSKLFPDGLNDISEKWMEYAKLIKETGLLHEAKKCLESHFCIKALETKKPRLK